jgi:hypothetical protein
MKSPRMSGEHDLALNPRHGFVVIEMTEKRSFAREKLWFRLVSREP